MQHQRVNNTWDKLLNSNVPVKYVATLVTLSFMVGVYFTKMSSFERRFDKYVPKINEIDELEKRILVLETLNKSKDESSKTEKAP